MSFTFHPGRPRLAWGGCPVFDGMTEERCQIMMKEKKVCSLCPEYKREKKRKYYIKEAFAALSLLLIMIGTANALGISSVWHGKVYSPTARQYGNIQVIDETGQVVKTLTLKPFPNRSTTTAFANWTTSASPGTYTAFYNLSSANGKVSYAVALQVEQTATVNVDPRSFWTYTGTGGRTLTQNVGVNPATLWNYTGARARKLDNLDAPVSGIAASVWGYGTRTLTSFGTLVADMASSVWGAVTRTVTGGTVTASNAPSVVDIDTRLSSTHPGNWAATGSGGGFVNTTGLGDYFAGRFGNGRWDATGSAGSGDTLVNCVNHPELILTSSDGNVGGFTVRFFLKSDYMAGRLDESYKKASTYTLDNGFIPLPGVNLDKGLVYMAVYTKQGYTTVTQEVTP